MSNCTYVVYRQAYHYGSTIGQNEGSDSVSLVPVRAFADRPAAEAHAAELMRVARRTVNPFEALHVPSESRVRALKLKFRVKPSDKWQALQWHRWYEAEAPHLTDEQREKFWSLYVDQPLYGVVEVPLGDA